MAKQRIDAIIIQKIATLAEWYNISRVPEKGEFMLIQNSASQPVNLRIGDGNRAFSALPNFIQYDQAAYVAPSGNTLPVPQNNVGYSILTAGTYNGNLVVPEGNLGVADYVGNAWVIRNMELPSTPVSDQTGSSTTTAASQRLVTEINSEIDGVKSILDVSESIFNQSELEDGLYFNFQGLSVGGLAPLTKLTAEGISSITTRKRLNKGDLWSVRGQGGENGRLYAVTDLNRVIKELAAPSLDRRLNPVTGVAQEDGYIYCNQIIATKSQFELKISANSIAAIDAEVDALRLGMLALEQQQTELSDSLSNISSTLLNLEEYTSSDLTAGQYINLGTATVGSIITPNTSALIIQTSGWSCPNNFIPVQEGKITIRTSGGNNGRAFVIARASDGAVLVQAAANLNTLTNPYVYEVVEPVRLYVNCMQAGLSQFKVTVESDQISKINQEIDVINSDILDLQNRKAEADIAVYKNSPMPLGKTTLKVLWPGNSYGDNTLEYLWNLVNSSGIDMSNLCIYQILQPGSSIQDWLSNVNNNVTKTCVRRAGSLTMPVVSGTMQEILSQDWDIIITGQASNLYLDFNGFNPALKQLISRYRQFCTNQRVSFAWQQIWGYANDYGGEPTGIVRYNRIVDSTKKMTSYNGIDIIIPCGTAIQNARQVTNPVIDGGRQLTSDGTHLQQGTAKYIAASAFFQSILAPMFNRAILGNTYRHALRPDETDSTAVAVTNSNFAVCQRAAFLACMDMWNINNPS